MEKKDIQEQLPQILTLTCNTQSNHYFTDQIDPFQNQNDKDYNFFQKNLAENQIYNQFCQDIFPPENSVELFKQFNESQNGEFPISQNQIQKSNQEEINIDNEKQFLLKRNRESAKQSRQKKKLYYQQLQLKNKENQKKIKELTLKLRETELQLNRLKNNSNKRAESFLQVIDVCVDKLTTMINSQNKHQKKALEQYCIQLKAQFGPAGKFRTDLLNYLMSQYMEHLLSDFQKYFMLSSLQEKGFFGKTSLSQLDKDVMEVLQIDEVKRTKILKKYGKCYEKAVIQFKQIRQKLYQCHVDLSNHAKSIQSVFHPMKKQISSATNFSKLIIFFNKNVHRMDIRQLKQQWSSSFSKQFQHEHRDKIRKKIKTNDQKEVK